MLESGELVEKYMLCLNLKCLCGFQAALYAAPYKSDFLKALSKGREVKEEECLEKIRKFLTNFTATVDAIYDMYRKMNADVEVSVLHSSSHQ